MGKGFLLLLCLVTLILACNRNAYRVTNKTYKKQVKQYAKVLRQYPLQDSVSNAPFLLEQQTFLFVAPILLLFIIQPKTHVIRL